jgi:hypothetical protein
MGNDVTEKGRVRQAPGSSFRLSWVNENCDGGSAFQCHCGIPELFTLSRELRLEDPERQIGRAERVSAAALAGVAAIDPALKKLHRYSRSRQDDLRALCDRVSSPCWNIRVIVSPNCEAEVKGLPGQSWKAVQEDQYRSK